MYSVFRGFEFLLLRYQLTNNKTRILEIDIQARMAFK